MDDFFGAEPSIPGHGGKRRGAGPKRRDSNGLVIQTLHSDFFGDEGTKQNEPSPYQRYEIARAEKEMHLARQAAVKADLDENEVVSRDAVIAAAARAFAACSQSLDAIGDALEREGFPIEVCERVMVLVNAAKEQLSRDLEKTHAANAG